MFWLLYLCSTFINSVVNMKELQNEATCFNQSELVRWFNLFTWLLTDENSQHNLQLEFNTKQTKLTPKQITNK